MAEPVIQQGVPLAPRCSLRVGGLARWFTAASSSADVAAAHAWSRSRGVPMIVLGGGTNVVVADAGLDALVVAVAPRGLAIDDEGDTLVVTAAAGEPWDAVVESAVARGGAGLECLSGIPGLTGGTPIQNVGAYGQDVAGVIERVTVFDTVEGAVARLPASECGFAYRTSRFKAHDAGRFVVCDVTFRLHKGAPTTAYAEVAASLARQRVAHPSVADVRATVIDIRRRKAMVIDETDPDTRSVGSFFTNPVVAPEDAERVAAHAGVPAPVFAQPGGRVKIPAAWLIERAGFARGARDGAVGLSSRHTLAIVTREGATAADVIRFAGRVARRVEDIFGVRLRPEPVFLGFGGGEAPPDVAYLLGARN
ncbi:MAG TPA: UDP-N-acetylmuramate dehydrogenase [Vicinamibacterales bacterium]|nr:UDP-N-acetylmuramate dehydrogenase [Vicinamibacterales bacterium]